MQTGLTLKQINRRRFFAACEALQNAYNGKGSIVRASLAVTAAKGLPGVPRTLYKFIPKIKR